MRLGILGGSFDPIHVGHLLVAEDVRRRLRLDQVLFVPSFCPPNRLTPMATYEHRVTMVGLALAGRTGLQVSTVEQQLPVPSYTVNTLKELGRRLPGESLYFILGADQYREMARWHAPDQITRLGRLVVISRPGTPRPSLYPGHDHRRVTFLDVIQVAVAARGVRARLAKGTSVRYILPAGVVQHIQQHRLYSEAGRSRSSLRVRSRPRSDATGICPKEN